jgi:hypothetical protein
MYFVFSLFLFIALFVLTVFFFFTLFAPTAQVVVVVVIVVVVVVVVVLLLCFYTRIKNSLRILTHLLPYGWRHIMLWPQVAA